MTVQLLKKDCKKRPGLNELFGSQIMKDKMKQFNYTQLSTEASPSKSSSTVQSEPSSAVPKTPAKKEEIIKQIINSNRKSNYVDKLVKQPLKDKQEA